MTVTSASPTRTAAAGLLALAVAMGVGRFAFTPILPAMQQEGLLDVAGGGALASIHYFGYLAGALMALRLPPSPGLALPLSLLAIALSTLAMGLTDNFAVWAACRLVAGVCSAFALVLVATHCVAALTEARRPGLHGVVFSGVGAGIALVGLGELVLMAAGVPSAQSWQAFSLVSLAALAFIWRWTSPGERRQGPAAGAHPPAPRSPLAWPAIVAYGAAGIGYIIPATFLPVMAREITDAPLVFGWCWPVFGAAAFLSTLLSARLHARFTNRQIWGASQLVMAAGLLAPALVQQMWVIVLAGLCVGGTFMIVTMAGLKEAHRLSGGAGARWHVTALTVAFAAGQMVGPVLAGLAYDATGSFSIILVPTSALLAITALTLQARPRAKESLAR